MTVALETRSAFAGSFNTDPRPYSEAPAANHVGGNLLVAVCSSQLHLGVHTEPTITDTAGNTWYVAVPAFSTNTGTFDNWLSIHYAYDIIGNAANVVRATWPNPAETMAYGEIVVFQLSGDFGSGDPLRDTSTGRASSGTACETDAAIGDAGDAIIEFMEIYPPGMSSSIYTITVVDTYFADGYDLTVSGPQKGSATLDNSAAWIIVAAAFMEVAGGVKSLVVANISATSSISGSVVARRKLTPGQISATSAVSGTVAKRFRISAAQVNAASTVSGALRVIRRVFTTQISATSSVSGAVVLRSKIVPTQISATSVVSGSVAKRFRLVSTQINATSTVSGAVVARRPIAPTQISAMSSVSGNVRATKRITTTQINAASSVSGSVVSKRAIKPVQISAISTVSGELASKSAIGPATITAMSTLTGSVVSLRRIQSSQINAVSTISGSLHRVARVAGGNILATSTMSGNIGIYLIVLGVQISAASTVTGTVSKRARISPANIFATSTVSVKYDVMTYYPTPSLSSEIRTKLLGANGDEQKVLSVDDTPILLGVSRKIRN